MLRLRQEDQKSMCELDSHPSVHISHTIIWFREFGCHQKDDKADGMH